MNRHLFFIFVLFLFSQLSFAEIPTECGEGKECLIEVKGSQCADGTPSFFTITKRKNAKHLLVYLSGGGACWSKGTCQNGLAKTLTRKEEPTDWFNGGGIHNANEKMNPFANEFDVITVPYCTGDVYMGSRKVDYGGGYKINHHGYKNMELTFEEIKKHYPNPDKVAMVGCSAGGIGSFTHLRNLRKHYPKNPMYVVDDAGTPFKPPYLKAANYEKVMKTWGADSILAKEEFGKHLTDFGTIVKDNTSQFSDVKFGYISGYRDAVMTFFAVNLGSDAPFVAVKKNIIDLADNDIGKSSPNAKVFYTESSRHCHTGEDIAKIVSEGTSLGSWLNDMIEDRSSWQNVRPDLHRKVQSVQDVMHEQESFRY